MWIETILRQAEKLKTVDAQNKPRQKKKQKAASSNGHSPSTVTMKGSELSI